MGPNIPQQQKGRREGQKKQDQQAVIYGLQRPDAAYYLNLLITITAASVDELEWKCAEMKKLLLSQDMDVQPCSFCQEQAFLPLRTVTFLKLLLLDGVPFTWAKQVFQRARLSEGEAQVMALARQALLSTAELIRCVELGITDISSDDRRTISPTHGWGKQSVWLAASGSQRSFRAEARTHFVARGQIQRKEELPCQLPVLRCR